MEIIINDDTLGVTAAPPPNLQIRQNIQQDYCITSTERDRRNQLHDDRLERAHRAVGAMIRERTTEAWASADGWPETADVLCIITDTDEWRKFAKVGVSENSSRTIEDFMNSYIKRFCDRIVEKWVAANVHDCLSYDDASDRWKNDSLAPDGWDMEEVMAAYYAQLTANIWNTLYYENHVFSPKELKLMIPNVDSPYWDSKTLRERYLNHFHRNPERKRAPE